MKTMLLIATLLLSVQSFAKVVCINSLEGTLNVGCPVPSKEAASLKNLVSEIQVYFYENEEKFLKDGFPLDKVVVEYCDTGLKTCRVSGEIKHDTGTYDVYRVVYSPAEFPGSVYGFDITKSGVYHYAN